MPIERRDRLMKSQRTSGMTALLTVLAAGRSMRMTCAP
jgi:hypothetical protein